MEMDAIKSEQPYVKTERQDYCSNSDTANNDEIEIGSVMRVKVENENQDFISEDDEPSMENILVGANADYKELSHCQDESTSDSEAASSEYSEADDSLLIITPKGGKGSQSSKNFKTDKYKCSRCPKEYSKNKDCMYKCMKPKCGKQFTRKDHYNRHHQIVHEKVRFTCKFCNDHFTQKYHLQMHLKKDICGMGQGPNGSRKVSSPRSKYKCHCGQGFLHPQSLQKHLNTIHSKVPGWGCDICERQFNREDNLKSHQRRVHGEVKK